ncbi:MAG: pyridoxal-phosphate-dependent aminotransferase family protein [Nocardioides sp.]
MTLAPEHPALAPVNPPARLLMGPGPISADPRVLAAMSAPLVGQFDPWMTETMNQTMALYREVFVTDNEQTFVIDGTARAGIEAALVSLITPGDTVLVPVFGRFGHLLVEIAERCGASVETIHRPWGEVFDPAEIEAAITRVHPAVLAMVQGDTSTTMLQPLAEIGAICAEAEVLFYCDTTASLAGNTFLADAWGVDVATAGLQKCLGGPSGSAPITISERAAAHINARKHVEAGIRTAADVPAGVTIGSNYFDLAQVMDYWGPRRLNHHTEATSMLYAARECARLLTLESMEAAVARHALHGAAMVAGIQGLDLQPYGDLTHKMNNVVGVHIPDAVDGEAVRARMLADFGIEIGTSFGPLAGVVWRIGTMGYNARTDAVLTTLAALEAVLAGAGHPVPAGGGVSAAHQFYRAHTPGSDQ